MEEEAEEEAEEADQVEEPVMETDSSRQLKSNSHRREGLKRVTQT